MVSWAEAIDRHFGLGSLRQRWPASCFVLLSAATACGAAPAASPGQARVPTLTNPCLSAPMRAFAVDRSQPRDYRRARSVFDRGIALQHEGRHAEALALFNRAVTIDGTFGLAHLEAAVSHLYTDNAQDALRKHLSAAVVLLPPQPARAASVRSLSVGARRPRAGRTPLRLRVGSRSRPRPRPRSDGPPVPGPKSHRRRRTQGPLRGRAGSRADHLSRPFGGRADPARTVDGSGGRSRAGRQTGWALGRPLSASRRAVRPSGGLR